MKIKWNYKGFDEVRKSPGVTSLVEQTASNLYGRVSSTQGYEIESKSYQTRNGVVIKAQDYPAVSDNLKNNTLAKLVTR